MAQLLKCAAEVLWQAFDEQRLRDVWSCSGVREREREKRDVRPVVASAAGDTFSLTKNGPTAAKKIESTIIQSETNEWTLKWTLRAKLAPSTPCLPESMTALLLTFCTGQHSWKKRYIPRTGRTKRHRRSKFARSVITVAPSQLLPCDT